MLDNFAFTLYEIFGYLLPGGVTLAGLMLLYWAFFARTVALGVSAQGMDSKWVYRILDE